MKKYIRYGILSLGLLFGAAAKNAASAQTVKKDTVVVPSLNLKAFSAFVKEIRKEALAKGISQKTIDIALPLDLKPSQRAVQLDRKQPEKKFTIDDYLALVIDTARIRNGVSNLGKYGETLKQVSDQYGVDAEVIVALWGLESSYGERVGEARRAKLFDVVTATATLAFDPRRSAMFRAELFAALKIIDQGHIQKENLLGAWAGATGQCQFMPTTFLAYAQDFNGDGRKDIWKTEADVFASIANYVSKIGWKKGESWGQRVTIPAGFDRSLINPDKKQSVKLLREKGLDIAAGGPAEGWLIQPGGAGTAAFVVYNNFQVIKKWNRSNHFAASVGILSDRLKLR